MKKYTHYRVGLLIGLLSLNTLSSCVSTRQELGMARDSRHEMGCTQGNWKRYWNRHPIQAKVCKMCTGVVGAGIIGGGIYGLSYLINPSNALNPNMNNGTNVTTIPPFTSTGWNTSTTPYNMDEERAQPIIDAIEKGKTRWGTDETSSDGNTSTTSATQAPGDGATVKDPMVLEDRIIDDITKHDYSQKRIQYWLDKGLNINARDTNGQTLLMYLAYYSAGESIIDFLLANKADPCITDNTHKTTLFHIQFMPVSDSEARDRIKEKLDAAIEELHGVEECPVV